MHEAVSSQWARLLQPRGLHMVFCVALNRKKREEEKKESVFACTAVASPNQLDGDTTSRNRGVTSNG
jgi:hypothetical protein